MPAIPKPKGDYRQDRKVKMYLSTKRRSRKYIGRKNYRNSRQWEVCETSGETSNHTIFVATPQPAPMESICHDILIEDTYQPIYDSFSLGDTDNMMSDYEKFGDTDIFHFPEDRSETDYVYSIMNGIRVINRWNVTEDIDTDTEISSSMKISENYEKVPFENRTDFFMNNINPNSFINIDNCVLRSDTADYINNNHQKDVDVCIERREEHSETNRISSKNSHSKIGKNAKSITKFVLEGRRVVDIAHLIESLIIIGNHAPHIGCTLKNMVIIGEKRKGLASTIKMKCNMCNLDQQLTTICDPIDINHSAVVGAMAVGSGYSHLKEITSALNVPLFAQTTYNQMQDEVSTAHENAALEEMMAAADEEKEFAIKAGNITPDGIPLVTVVCDGVWARRSYRTNFNSLSGAAAIVGFHTKKVLFLSVRNKFCIVCRKTENKPEEITDHVCYRNWNGSSSAMESDIICEGFQRSMDMHGIIYHEMIADGDSSCYKKLLDSNPYRKYNITVRKIECRNHLLRNYINKIRDLAKDTNAGPLILRKEIKKNELRFRWAITEAVKFRKSENNLIKEKVENLKQDILNSPSHIFGEHKNCADYFCKSTNMPSQSIISDLKLTVNILSFITGASLTWSSPELDKLSNATDTPFSNGISDDQRSWIASLTPLGSIIGPFIVGYLTDSIGRKNTILTNAVSYVICYLLLALGTEVWIFYMARFFIGLVIGGVFTVIPMYIGEIADDTNRGALGSTMNVFLCAGEFFSLCVGPYTKVMIFNSVLVTFPCICLLLVYFLSPETPQYLISKGRHEEAKAALHKLRGSGIDVEDELNIMQTRNKEGGEEGGSIMDIYRSKALIKSLVMTLGLVIFQQASGISAVLFYTQTIFAASGSPLKPAVCSIIIGVIQFGTSFLTPLIVDRLGRKILLLVSVVGMILAEVPLGVYFYYDKHGTNVSAVSFLPIVCMIAYVIFFNFGYGPLPWAILGEVFPINVKSIASSITCAASNVCVFLVSKYFESISNAVGMGTSFLIFSGFCAAAVPFTMFFVIETKGKNVEEIQKELDY